MCKITVLTQVHKGIDQPQKGYREVEDKDSLQLEPQPHGGLLGELRHKVGRQKTRTAI